MREWDPDQALQDAVEENRTMDVNINDPFQVADAVGKIFRESAQAAAMSVVHMALHEENPRVRLDAAKYVTDQAKLVTSGSADPLAQLVSDIYKHADAFGKGQAE